MKTHGRYSLPRVRCFSALQGTMLLEHGAHSAYRPSASSPLPLCPNCHWRWLCARSSLPWSRPSPTRPPILQLMSTLSAECVLGAGVASSRIGATLRQRLRRHVRQWLPTDWIPMEAFNSFRTACAPMLLPVAALRCELQAVVEGMAQQGSTQLRIINGRTQVRKH